MDPMYERDKKKEVKLKDASEDKRKVRGKKGWVDARWRSTPTSGIRKQGRGTRNLDHIFWFHLLTLPFALPPLPSVSCFADKSGQATDFDRSPCLCIAQSAL